MNSNLIFCDGNYMASKCINNIDNGTRVCLVTEELAGIGGSGGIGAAFLELAKLLAARGALVDVLYCPVAGTYDSAEQMKLSADFIKVGIKLYFLDASSYVVDPITYEKKSYAIAQWLSDKKRSYSFIHFHDYKGLGFFSTSLKRQGLAFSVSTLIVQLHGPTRWTIDANGSFFIHEDQLKIDHMERMSIAQADMVVSPSAYLVEWLKNSNFVLPKDVRVIKNVCSELHSALERYKYRQDLNEAENVVTDIILFARHEDRKGFAVFCDAIDQIHDQLLKANVTVSFVGKFGMVNSQPSGIYLIERAKRWKFPIKIRTGLARNDAAEYIISCARPVVVIPSPVENSPYTVLESIMLGAPVISSLGGGGPELFHDADYPGLCEINCTQLASKMLSVLQNGLSIPTPSESSTEIESHWLKLHMQAPMPAQEPIVRSSLPKVSFAITHYERPNKLVDAVLSAVQQTYKNIEIIVVDDGSKTPETLVALEKIERILDRVNGRLVRQENAYLGAARNCAIRASSGEYILFLDDDDIAIPELVETLVLAAETTGADAVNCMNIFMDETLRGEVLSRSEKAPSKVSYVPLGGPLALAPTENCLGAATALFRKSALTEIGGYTELQGVGHEDYELFIRLLQADKLLTIVPRPLYFYETGRPSMLSRTSLVTNFRRCFDALDTNRDSEHWRDILSLSVGKQTAVNAHNRQWWLYSLTKTAALRHRILGESLDRITMLECLIDLAKQEAATRLGAAFAEDIAPASSITDESYLSFDELIDPVEKTNGIVVAVSPNELELLNARIDLVLGRPVDSIKCLTRYISEIKILHIEVVTFVKQLVREAGHLEISSIVWKDLADALRYSRCSRGMMTDMREAMISLSLLSNDMDSMFSIVMPDIENLEPEYLKRHKDVAAGVKSVQFSSGLDHFLSFGMHEGRLGFEVLKKIIEFSVAVPSTRELVDRFINDLRTAIERKSVEGL